MTANEVHLRESVSWIQHKAASAPRIGIVLGSGLGEFADALDRSTSLPTRDIPHYPQSAVAGHKGKLVFGTLSGKEILAFQGRVHFYESNSVEATLYPILVAYNLGVRTLLVTNAAGGLNRSLCPGNLMIITDQLNLTALRSDLIQVNQSNALYSKRLMQIASDEAKEISLDIKRGVYVGLKGPSYETAAEVEMVHRIGGDAVGMSTVLEVLLASQLGMEVLGISCITNLGTGIGTEKLSHEEVTQVGNQVKASFALLLSRIVAAL